MGKTYLTKREDVLEWGGIKIEGNVVTLPDPPKGLRWVVTNIERTAHAPIEDFAGALLTFEAVLDYRD